MNEILEETKKTTEAGCSIPRFMIAGTHSGVGKTTIAVGIMAALTRHRFTVQAFKAGPDYIDPTFHHKATNRFSRNLDSWMLSREMLQELFEKNCEGATIAVIEGVMGLFDGKNGTTEEGSSAHIAKMLNCPVVLVVDAGSMARSAAALIMGYQKFDPDLNIIGVIFNNVGSDRHFELLENSVEKYLDIPVFGYLGRNEIIEIRERHLGLTQLNETAEVENFISNLANFTERNIDLSKIVGFANKVPSMPKISNLNFKTTNQKVKIGVARDDAFNFYYEDNLDLLRLCGAEIVFFSPLKDKNLPEVNGLYFGGGYPELYGTELADNKDMREQIYTAVKDGTPTYAECGGLMYLTKKIIDFETKEHKMVGILPVTAYMKSKFRSLGYVEAEVKQDNILAKAGDKLRGHVFHWSTIDDMPKIPAYYLKNQDIMEGFVEDNLLASYVHLHFGSNLNLAKNFVESCEKYKTR